ncbi:MAG: VOC family protein [Pseudomonadota bacterium]
MDLNQVTLPVTDFDAAFEFYVTIGLKPIVSAEKRYARFELPSGGSTLSLHHVDAVSAGGVTIYFECDDIDARYETLRAKGVVFDSPPTDQRWRWREARLRDPSGNTLCLYHAGLDRRFPPWRIEPEADKLKG